MKKFSLLISMLIFMVSCSQQQITEDMGKISEKTITSTIEKVKNIAMGSDAELIEKGSEYGDVWETYDLTNVTSDDIAMLKKVANSKKAILRFESENNYYDYTIPSQDKKAIKQVLAAYDSLQ